MNRTAFFIFLSILLFVAKSHSQDLPMDSIVNEVDQSLAEQLLAFPQEKIYIQTDKRGYLSGERIWFRAHLQDALSHQAMFLSRYVYVELFNPFDNLVERIKVRPDSTGTYSGYIDLHDDLSEGSYTMRAYTQYMRNASEELYAKKNIEVYDPFSLEVETLVDFEVNKNNINANIKFVDRQTNDTIKPEIVSCQLAHKESKQLKAQANNNYNWSVKLDEKISNRTMLLSIMHNKRKYSRFYTIPSDRSQFDVAFFPEGGYLIPSVVNQVAFKALHSDGWGVDVTGTVFNSQDEKVTDFSSKKHGMGFFNFMPVLGDKYYAEVSNQSGDVRRIDLPELNDNAIVVTTRMVGGRMLVGVNGLNETVGDDLSLLIHHKGRAIYHKPITKGVGTYTFPADNMPMGIINVMILNAKKDIVSERLVFNMPNDNLVKVDVTSSKGEYKRREHIPITMQLDNVEEGLTSGSIAISVIDKQTVMQDSTNNIVSYLLLSSELRGHIESPASYFIDNKIDKHAIDALLMTQGWRRYDLPKVLKGEIETPTEFEPELAQKIKGKADGLFSGLKGGNISLMATIDSLLSTVATEADEKGRFEFDVEYPAGTSILVQSLSKRGGKSNVINLDKETFPETSGASLSEKPVVVNRHDEDLDLYLQKANEDYTRQFGIRTILLEDFTVTAESKEKYKESTFYTPLSATGVRTADDIEKMNVSSFRTLLYSQPGIIVRPDMVTTTRSDRPVLFVIDNMYFDDFSDRLDDIDVSSIESLFVVRDNSMMPGYFPNTDGAIVITTKIGFKPKARTPININHIIPLGYQQAAEFYSPAYETPEQKDNGIPDLRTTIYWKPNVVFDDEGRASIEFYAADLPTNYLLVGEGVSSGGNVIRFEHEVEVID